MKNGKGGLFCSFITLDHCRKFHPDIGRIGDFLEWANCAPLQCKNPKAWYQHEWWDEVRLDYIGLDSLPTLKDHRILFLHIGSFSELHFFPPTTAAPLRFFLALSEIESFTCVYVVLRCGLEIKYPIREACSTSGEISPGTKKVQSVLY